ncbi:MAG: ferritin [Thermosphaera sp.]|jgi:ferritin|nr:ferritin [Thermosphaera sp.]
MNEEVLKALNKQLNQELQNAYLYLSMAAFFDEKSLTGFSHYFKVQAKEELEHAMKFYEHIIDRGGVVELYDVPAPSKKWKSILEAVQEFYDAEVRNTGRIWELVNIARKHEDKATEVFLQWFINEQVEEEKNASELLAKVKMVGDNIAGILALDRMLAERK